MRCQTLGAGTLLAAEMTHPAWSWVCWAHRRKPVQGQTACKSLKGVTALLAVAGEHTCKEHPDTVGGAMLTGLREGVRVFHMLKGEDAFGKAAAALVDKDAVRKRKKVCHPAVAPRCWVL